MTKTSSVKHHKLLNFVIITFVFSWAFWIPKALVEQGIITNSFLGSYFAGPWNLGAFGPFVAAFYLTHKYQGRKGVVNLLKRGISTDFSKKWLIPILLLMPIITGIAYISAQISSSATPDLSLLYQPHLILYWFLYMLLLGGPLQEEFGWRGHALDILQFRYSALKSSVFLGIIWALWHLPLNFTSDVGPQYSIAISMFIGSLITMTLLSILFTWIYNNTNRSILSVLLFHASINFSSFKLFPVFESELSLSIYTLLILLTAICVIIFWGPRKFVRVKH